MNTGIPSPLNLFVTDTVQLVAKVVDAKKIENLANLFIWKVNIKIWHTEKIGRHFFHNIENKQDLCNLFANFIKKSYLRDTSDVPVVIANNMDNWFVTDQYVEKLFESNHEETGTLYTKNTNSVIVSKDTDILIR